MKIDDCFQIGAIVKTHGYKGEVVLHLDVDDPLGYKELESMFLEQAGKLVPFFIQKSELHQDKLRVKLEDIADEGAAKSLVGTRAFLPLELLPDLGAEDYYYHEIIGFEVILDQLTVGRIMEIYDQNPNVLFGFETQGKEVLVPINDTFIKKVDKARQQIHINLPEGYLDIYLDDEA